MTEIKLDYDGLSRTGLLRLIRRRWWFLFRFCWPKFGRLHVRHINVRRTNHGFHVRATVKEKIEKRDLNFVQLAFGSDFQRECLNLRRILTCKRMRNWNILFWYKMNSRGRRTSQERTDRQTTKQVEALIRSFQKGGVRRHE